MTNVFGLTNTLRDMKRYAEILRVLVQHGFADIVHELKLDGLLEKGMTLVGGSIGTAFGDLSRAERLRRAMEELGTTFIKLGQILSTRPDLVPAEWAKEFKQLQGNCTPIPFEKVQERLKAEFPRKLSKTFRSIDHKPLATASIAQVHRAILTSGEKLLLKIVRPGIEEVIESDIAILETLAELAEQYFSNLGYSPREIVREFSREIHREIDLTHEGRATDRFRTIFADDPDVIFPKVYWKATTTFVLGVEEIKGILLSQIKKEDLTQAERCTLVRVGARAVFRQCLEVGFFHADPHPGNLFALPHGRIAFIDCGMVGQLDDETMQHVAQLVIGVVQGDLERVIEVVAFFSDADPEKIESRAFRADVREFVSNFEHTPLGNLNMGMLLELFFEKLREHHLRCPGDLVLLIKALTTIESVGKQLDPTFDMVSFAEPYVKRLVDRRYGVPALKERIGKSMAAYATFAETLPKELGQLLRQFRRNKIAVNLEHRGLSRLTTTIEHASRNISFSLVVAAMLIGSSILVLADRNQTHAGVGSLGLTGFLIACVLILFRWIVNRKHKG
jgi:ubiquinone biosynthesis protein